VQMFAIKMLFHLQPVVHVFASARDYLGSNAEGVFFSSFQLELCILFSMS
jgi:hypothetical protein